MTKEDGKERGALSVERGQSTEKRSKRPIRQLTDPTSNGEGKGRRQTANDGGWTALKARQATDLSRYRRENGQRRAEIIFWGCVAMITLLLTFGKFFPLYALFYQLPMVSSIRNPNKFLQVFQLALGILAAYGLDEVLRSKRRTSNSP